MLGSDVFGSLRRVPNNVRRSRNRSRPFSQYGPFSGMPSRFSPGESPSHRPSSRRMRPMQRRGGRCGAPFAETEQRFVVTAQRFREEPEWNPFHVGEARLFDGITDVTMRRERARKVLLERAAPLVVIDTCEHAFYIDYQNRKAGYVEKFVDHIDWNEVQTRFRVHA